MGRVGEVLPTKHNLRSLREDEAMGDKDKDRQQQGTEQEQGQQQGQAGAEEQKPATSDNVEQKPTPSADDSVDLPDSYRT